MKTLIRNVGQILSGDIAAPLLDGDSILLEDGRIAVVARGLDGAAETIIDARGSTVMPGLIDSHCHPVFGDFTPRQRTIDFNKDAAFVRTHFDAMEVRLVDAPKADEILVALVVTDSGRPHPRVGGLTVDEARKDDGLR